MTILSFTFALPLSFSTGCQTSGNMSLSSSWSPSKTTSWLHKGTIKYGVRTGVGVWEHGGRWHYQQFNIQMFHWNFNIVIDLHTNVGNIKILVIHWNSLIFDESPTRAPESPGTLPTRTTTSRCRRVERSSSGTQASRRARPHRRPRWSPPPYPLSTSSTYMHKVSAKVYERCTGYYRVVL